MIISVHFLTEQLDETWMAVRFVMALLESSLVQLLETKCANEVLWVELPAHGGDASTKYGLMAAIAERTTTFMVVELTEWLVLVFKEVSTSKWLLTGLTDNDGSVIPKQQVTMQLSCGYETKHAVSHDDARSRNTYAGQCLPVSSCKQHAKS